MTLSVDKDREIVLYITLMARLLTEPQLLIIIIGFCPYIPLKYDDHFKSPEEQRVHECLQIRLYRYQEIIID